VKNPKIYISVSSIIIISILAFFLIHNHHTDSKADNNIANDSVSIKVKATAPDTNFYRAVFEDTSGSASDYNSISSLAELGTDKNAGYSSNEFGNARRINIVLLDLMT